MKNKQEIVVVKDPQIFISKEARVIFDNMRELDEFNSMDNKDLFMLAVSFGYLKNSKKTLKNDEKTQSGFTRERYLTNEDNSILKAIAIKENNEVGIIENIQNVYSVAEEYANGGIKYLKEFVFNDPASLEKKLADMLSKEIK